MASIPDRFLERFGRHSGLLAPLVFVSATIIAIIGFHGYNPLEDYLSHLGVNPRTAVLFNLGILISGACGIVFTLFLWKRFVPGPAKSGAFLMGAALVFFSLLSVFTEQVPGIHLFMAGMFFSMAFAAMVLAAAGLRHVDAAAGGFSLLTALPVALLFFSGIHPAAEHLAAAAVMAWFVGMWKHSGRDTYLRYEWVWM
jgi:hypothetical membrane protein